LERSASIALRTSLFAEGTPDDTKPSCNGGLELFFIQAAHFTR
jgi:hypothetical protein